MADQLRPVSTPTSLHIPKEEEFDPEALLEECLADLNGLEESSSKPAPFPSSTAPKLDDPLGENAELKEVMKQLEAFFSNPPDPIDSLVEEYKTDPEQLKQQMVE